MAQGQSDELSLAAPLAADIECRRESLTLTDGHSVDVLQHSPPGGATAAPVLYVHGIQSHPGWFIGSAEALARAGREVFQVTRRGSGLTQGRRGDAASAGQLLDDTQAAVEYVLERAGAGSVALVGVSWGGKLLTAYVLAADEPRIASLTLVAPGLRPRVDVSAATKLAIAAARVLQPRRCFDIPLNDPALFTDNPAMREYLQGDPLRLRRATARFLVASAMLDRSITRAADGSLKPPTTLFLASRDQIIDNAATRALVDRLTAGRADAIELEAAHTIEFEPDPREFQALLVAAVAAGE